MSYDRNSGAENKAGNSRNQKGSRRRSKRAPRSENEWMTGTHELESQFFKEEKSFTSGKSDKSDDDFPTWRDPKGNSRPNLPADSTPPDDPNATMMMDRVAPDLPAKGEIPKMSDPLESPQPPERSGFLSTGGVRRILTPPSRQRTHPTHPTHPTNSEQDSNSVVSGSTVSRSDSFVVPRSVHERVARPRTESGQVSGFLSGHRPRPRSSVEQFDEVNHPPAPSRGGSQMANGGLPAHRGDHQIDGGDFQDEYGGYFDEQDEEPRSVRRTIIEWVLVIAGAVFLAFIVRTFLLQAFWIPTPSMNDTLQKGDRILVNKISYLLGDVERLDVIVFKNPDPVAENKELIKRVIGLPGEQVQVVNGQVYIDSQPIGEEPYVVDDGVEMPDFAPVVVPDDSFFVMGDNRNNSRDSRSPEVGFISEDLVVGKAFVKFWPPSRMGRIE